MWTQATSNEEMIQLINNNQCNIFVEMNKYNESQIHNLIDENEQIWGAIKKQMEINEDIEKDSKIDSSYSDKYLRK